MSLQYLLSKRARVYTPEADDGDIEQGLTEGGNADNDLTDTLTYFSFGEFKLELNGTERQLKEISSLPSYSPLEQCWLIVNWLIFVWILRILLLLRIRHHAECQYTLLSLQLQLDLVILIASSKVRLSCSTQPEKGKS